MTPRRLKTPTEWVKLTIDQQMLWEMLTMWPNLYPTMALWMMYYPHSRTY